MISNRQGGRRRGRGGPRPQNVGGRPDANRQDNRQRGNATQLLEKYKNMARDAQLSGDRVQMEYFLQFADHYFRVLNESRARFEEQRRQRGDDGDDSDDEDGSEASDDQDGDEERQEEEQRPQRPQRRQRGERNQRSAGEDRGSDERKTGNGPDRSNGSGERIAMEALPPAIRRDEEEQSQAAEEEAPKPRRRARRPRSDDGEAEMAPAA